MPRLPRLGYTIMLSDDFYFTDYECYDESDPSPRYTFANPHADDEGLPTTFNAPFQDQPSQQATGYLNPAFQPNTVYYPTT